MSEHEGIWTEYRPTYWDGWSAVKRMGDLVRCRDCKHAHHYHPFNPYTRKPSEIEDWYCGWHSNAEGASEIEPDGFCAWGERRDA